MTVETDLSEEEIDQVGYILEHSGFTDSAIDAFFLDHFGTKGMRWGIRKSKKVTGVSRPRGATIDRNARYRSSLNKAKAGKKYRISMALGRAFIGKEQQHRRMNNKITDLNKQSARLKKGKLTLEDRFDLWNTVPLADLVISRTPR